MTIKRIAVNTGGGDAPGLNAVIRAVVLAAENQGWEVYGIQKGYNGILNGDGSGVVRLDRRAVRGITHLGGTILGTTNRGNPMEFPEVQADGSVVSRDRTPEILEVFRERGWDALVAIGGDGSLRIAHRLHELGLPVVGVPKTIDNDLAATAVTFGFFTAVDTATDALDKLHSTAEAHERVMVVELMGRHTGWIALFAGLAGTADVILIPEIPYRLDRVCESIERRYETGRRFAIVAVAEGARAAGEGAAFVETGRVGAADRYGGIADRLAQQIGERTGRETRSLVLGHLQRGGHPNAYDRLLSLRFGAAAVKLIQDGCFGCMVALDPPDVKAVPLVDAIRELKQVPLDGDVIATARSQGISLGD
ncbi:MAG: ATP-dependent 6-phosphofructokinase [Gemmatimonadota bacterium]